MKIKTLLFVALATLATTLTAQITVDNRQYTNAQYSDLQEAIDAATDGSTIYIHPSENSYGYITIDKPLVLVGRTPQTKKAVINRITFSLNGSNTTIKGLSISELNIKTATNLVIESNNIYHIDFPLSSSATQSIALIKGNNINEISNPQKTIITNNLITVINGIKNINTTLISNNLILSSISNHDFSNQRKAVVSNCIFLVNNAGNSTTTFNHLNMSNCLFYNYGGGTVTLDRANSTNCSFTDIIENQDPMFTAFNTNDLNDITNDFTLQTGSPALNAGSNNEEIGIMNGYSYRANLQPYGYPTVEILTSTAQVPENGNLKVVFTGNSN